MIKKFLVYCKSDGLGVSLRMVYKTLFKTFRTSRTLFFKKKVEVFDISKKYTNVVIKELSAHEMQQIDFPRLQLLDCETWMMKGSRVFVAFVGNHPVGFSWVHFKEYEIHDMGVFKLTDKECWLGPYFVHKLYRGNGIQKALISYNINQVQYPCYYTSVNERNIPSLKSFKYNGFEMLGICNQRTFLWGKKYSILGDELNQHFYEKDTFDDRL